MNPCIYGLRDPRTAEFRYVGRTARDLAVRLREHLLDANRRTQPVSRWVKELKDAGLSPEIVLLQKTRKCLAVYRERQWVEKLTAGGLQLLNRDGGGSGRQVNKKRRRARRRARATINKS